MIRKTIKYLGALLAIYSLFCLITPFNKTLRNRSIQNQINYLSHILDVGYDDELQKRFPEGKLFSNCLLALSTIEYCNNYQLANDRYAEVVDNCIRRIQSKRALAVFDQNLNPKYGIFYQGWTNLVYSTYLNSPVYEFSKIQTLVQQESLHIESELEQLQADSLRTLETYNGSFWPADNLIGIASLENHDLQSDWIDLILETSEHESGLIHHVGSSKNRIRGSSSAMITYCLNKSNYSDIEDYNHKFKDIFVDSYMGIQLVKEYEDGSDRFDVDSGPILMGYGASATIMNIKTQASLSSAHAKVTWAAMNFISIPFNMFRRKYFLFKKEPMLDLFMLWASTEL